MIQIFPLPALRDNYIWVIRNPDNSLVTIVDPGDATPVINYLQQHNLQLSCILVTHHHWDHTGGIAEILKKYPVPVFGPTGQDVTEGQEINLPDQNITLKVMHIPGHTLDHVAYYNNDMVFTGDTLFSAGCGRVFEGTHQQMLDSLTKLKSLPKDTNVYCGHEYTVNNLRFALTVEPDNAEMQQRLIDSEKQREKGLPTLPSTIGLELETNPFFRTTKLYNFVKTRVAKDAF